MLSHCICAQWSDSSWLGLVRSPIRCLVAGFVLRSSGGKWENWGRGVHKGEQRRKKGGAHANTVCGAPPPLPPSSGVWGRGSSPVCMWPGATTGEHVQSGGGTPRGGGVSAEGTKGGRGEDAPNIRTTNANRARSLHVRSRVVYSCEWGLEAKWGACVCPLRANEGCG